MDRKNFIDEIQSIGSQLQQLDCCQNERELGILLKCCDRLRYVLVNYPVKQLNCLIKDIYSDIEYTSYCLHELIEDQSSWLADEKTECHKKALQTGISLITKEINLLATFA